MLPVRRYTSLGDVYNTIKSPQVRYVKLSEYRRFQDSHVQKTHKVLRPSAVFLKLPL